MASIKVVTHNTRHITDFNVQQTKLGVENKMNAKAAFFTVLLLIFPIFAFSDTLTGRVVGVADGDTVTVLDAQHTQHKVRLMGIDAPE